MVIFDKKQIKDILGTITVSAFYCNHTVPTFKFNIAWHDTENNVILVKDVGDGFRIELKINKDALLQQLTPKIPHMTTLSYFLNFKNTPPLK